ncbi:MAG: methyltransferase domain-containing protein [Gammaproteobacteria bacterium]
MSDLAGFLEAKFELDERSLNPEVRQSLIDAARGLVRPKILDVGTGTGAMLKRLIRWLPDSSLSLTALDRDPGLLKIAEDGVSNILNSSGFRRTGPGRYVPDGESGREIETAFFCADLSDFEVGSGTFDLIAAHAIMDLVPLPQAVDSFYSLLKPGGLFYATIHYDGETVLFPGYGDAEFEKTLLAAYDVSMERRTVEGLPTGGAFCGRRLYRSLADRGFEIQVYGSSDWNATPKHKAYRGGDGEVIFRLLQWMAGEAGRCPGIDPEALKLWLSDRTKRLENAELGVIIRNLDILARRP